jgi:cation transport ATPase
VQQPEQREQQALKQALLTQREQQALKQAAQAYSKALLLLQPEQPEQQKQRALKQVHQAYSKAQQQEQRALKQAHQTYSKALQAQQQEQRALKQAHQQKLQQESLFLGISAVCFIVMLILLLRQRNRISLTLTGQLICFFPEECIAELEALHKQMGSEQHSIWLIRMIMLQNFLELFLAFYVQINIENLWLPQHRGRKNTDK